MSTSTTKNEGKMTTPKLRKKISAQLTKYIDKHHLPSQQAFAQMCCVAPSIISKILRKKVTISPLTAIEIALNGGIPLDYIYGLSDNDSSSAATVSMIEQYISASTSEREFKYSDCSRKYKIPIISVSKCFKDYLDTMRKSTQSENDSIRDAYRESAGRILTQNNYDDNSIMEDYVLIPYNVLNNAQMLEDLGIMPETQI